MKRFHDTEIWEEDWFIALDRDYRDLWIYIKDKCDHAGIWRPNVVMFNKLYGCATDINQALEIFNRDREKGKERVIALSNGKWFLCQFIPFQYGQVLNPKNRVHASILALLKVNEVNLTSIRPQVEVNETSNRPQDDLNLTSNRPQLEVNDRVKDKDKDKDKDKYLKGIVKGEWKYLQDDRFVRALEDFLDMRRKIKKPATDRAFEIILKKLHAVSVEDAIAMLEKSTVSNWPGIYPLKNPTEGQKPAGVDLNRLLHEKLGRLASKDAIKAVLRGLPQESWGRVNQWLRNRWPDSSGRNFAEAERELIAEGQIDKEKLSVLTSGVGKAE